MIGFIIFLVILTLSLTLIIVLLAGISNVRRDIKWDIIFFSLIGLTIYWAIMNNLIVVMDQMSLGRPDPAIFGLFLIIIVRIGYWALKIMWQNNSCIIATNAGGIITHNLEPMATFDPLDYWHIDEDKADELKKLVKQNPEKTDEGDWIQEIIDEKGITIEAFKEIRDEFVLEMKTKQQYDWAIHALTVKGIWTDCGVQQLGMQGLRFGGRDILILDPDFLKIFHEKGAVCVAWVECFHGMDQFENTKELIKPLMDILPRFIPGKHSIVYGTEPHDLAVRAWNERIEQWEWTLGHNIAPINSQAREKWIKHLIGIVSKEEDERRDEYNYLLKTEGKETLEIPAPVPVPVVPQQPGGDDY